MTRKTALLCLAIVLVPFSASSSEDSPTLNPDSHPAGSRVCGHARELQVAKRALAEGDREVALRHLQRARALLAACERNTVNPAPEWESTTSSRAFARQSSAGPDRPLATRFGSTSRSG